MNELDLYRSQNYLGCNSKSLLDDSLRRLRLKRAKWRDQIFVINIS
jgi:hypothetical protein